tara:strand:+ start:15708 stop:16067 length:360 start_codon:yes stop_codon:yes gene_type:complete
MEKKALEGVKDWEEKDLKPLADSYTPKDTGDLRGSYLSELLPTKAPGSVFTYRISYGNGLVGSNGENYAAEVHDWPSDKNWTTPGTGPRYLERAKNETVSLLQGKVSKSIKTIMNQRMK